MPAYEGGARRTQVDRQEKGPVTKSNVKGHSMNAVKVAAPLTPKAFCAGGPYPCPWLGTSPKGVPLTAYLLRDYAKSRGRLSSQQKGPELFCVPATNERARQGQSPHSLTDLVSNQRQGNKRHGSAQHERGKEQAFILTRGLESGVEERAADQGSSDAPVPSPDGSVH